MIAVSIRTGVPAGDAEILIRIGRVGERHDLALLARVARRVIARSQLEGGTFRPPVRDADFFIRYHGETFFIGQGDNGEGLVYEAKNPFPPA